VLPKIEGVYKWDDRSPTPDGILLSHAHLDHYGFFRFVRPDTRYYLGEGTRRLIDLTALFINTGCHIENHVFLKSGEALQVGEFTVTPYLMDHSAFDAYAFLIEGAGKKIIYSGDFRSHGRKSKAFEWFLEKAPRGVDALLMEGSMIGRQTGDPHSEKAIEDELTAVFGKSTGIVFCLVSGQNIDRLVSIYRAALKSNRMFVVDLYTATVLHELGDMARIPHPSEAFRSVRVFYPYRLAVKLKREGKERLLYRFKKYKIIKKEIAADARNCVMLMRQSMIPDIERIATCENLDYSMWDGYLKEASSLPLVQFIERHGLKMVHIHTSGHAGISTLQRVVRELRPKAVVPIHTFMPHAYAKLLPGVRIIRAADGVPFEMSGKNTGQLSSEFR
jgi:ribonuclease J